MRSFRIAGPSITPSYENAIAAGSLAHTGNSFRPIGAPVKRIQNPSLVQPPSYNAPVANPVVPRGRVTGAASPIVHVPVAHPIPVGHPIRGIIGQ